MTTKVYYRHINHWGTFAIEQRGEMFYVSTARVAAGDQFCRRIGRAIAGGRLRRALAELDGEAAPRQRSEGRPFDIMSRDQLDTMIAFCEKGVFA